MLKREKSARNLYLPYKQFGIDIFKKEMNTPYNSRNVFFNSLLKTPMSSFRPFSKIKSDSLFDVEKKLKKMTLSNKAFLNYMNKYTKLTQNFTFKTPNISLYPKKKNPKYLPIVYLEKIGYKSEEENINDNEKVNKNENNFINFNFKNINDIDQVNYYNNDNNKIHLDNDDDNNFIAKKPYGFKYKDTRIVFDKSKMRAQSSLFRNNNSEFNLTNIIPNQNYKNKTNFNFHISKEEKRKNKVFKYFYEGDFLSSRLKRPQSQISYILENKKNNNNIIINDNDVNNNINILYDMIKNIKNINNFATNKTMKYNIKNYYKKEDFTYQVDINSICLKFINQDYNENDNKNKSRNNAKNKSQKLYIPFAYLPLFYLLDFTTFKIFLSEIIYYNKETNLMQINEKDAISILNKYKKFITINIINQDPFKKRKLDKITYYCKEHLYQNIYDWIIYLDEENNNHFLNDENNENNENDENEGMENDEENEINKRIFTKNIIYKVKLIMPLIKFQIINRRIKIKKHLNKNLIIKLLKNDFLKWEENVLCELFLNKKFRNIMNSTLASNKHIYNYSFLTKKIFIDRIDNKDNFLNKTKYEFFITNSSKIFSHFLYYSPYSILILYGKEKNKKIFTNIHLNIKESINLKKYSKYWGYMNTLNKCLKIDQNSQKIYLDLQILEKDPKKFFYLKKSEIQKNNQKENLKEFENLGFIKYQNNEIEMSLLNCAIVEIQITPSKMDKRFYKVPHNLLEIFLSENLKEDNNLNKYLSEFCELILFNDDILHIRREEIDLRRKAFQNDGTIKFDEDFQTEKHKTIFSFKNLSKLNSFIINPKNRYSNNPGINKSIGSGMNFYSGENNLIKRSETNDNINFAGLGINLRSYDQLYKSQKVKRKYEKKYTVYQRKRDSQISNKNVKDFENRNHHKNNTNILILDKEEKEEYNKEDKDEKDDNN